MMRRLYFAIPDARQARRILDELRAAGVDAAGLSALAGPGVDLAGLPAASEAQARDRIWLLDRLFWRGSLTLFFGALAALVLAAANGWIPGVIGALAVLVVSFLSGYRFLVRLPHSHLADLRVPLSHGEIVLLVDVPRGRVAEIEERVSRRHPEAHLGGVGWSLHALGA